MTPLHDEHAAVVAIANAWFTRDRELWYAGLELAKCLDRTLLACVYQRLREVRDDVAREAFTRQTPVAEVARERLDRLREMRPQTKGAAGAAADGGFCSCATRQNESDSRM